MDSEYPNSGELPFVSAMVVVRNEEKYISKCLQSLLEQDYPNDRYEIIVVDGESNDSTLRIVRELADKSSAPVLRIENNPNHYLAAGWNIGIRKAVGELIVRIDAHAFAESDFLSVNVKTIMNIQDAACVGGQMTTISDTSVGELIKDALSNPFGIGGSKFRYAKVAGYVDTVAYGMYRCDVFDQVGFLDERLIRTQDNDLHRRMRDTGMKFYLNPEIRSYYCSRNTTKKLIKQQFNNGKWTMINFMLRPGKMSVRHFVPLVFLLALLGTIIAGVVMKGFWLLTVAGVLLHLSCGFVYAIKQTKKLLHILALPFLFLIIHTTYGLGSIAGYFSAAHIKAS